MQEHPRSLAAREAAREMGAAWLAVVKKYKLTPTEQLMILNAEAAMVLKFCLRAERHPADPDRPADVV